MIKINYPSNLLKFQTKYLQTLQISDTMRSDFRKIINKDPFLKRQYELDDILLGSMEELLEFKKDLRYLYISQSDKEELRKILNYDSKDFNKKYQPLIKNFFEKNLQVKTCYFCNIDFINAFSDLGDYHDSVDFIKRASITDLQKIKGIGISTAHSIKRHRSNLLSLRKVKNKKNIISNIKNMRLKEEYSHFTLDHLIDKGSNPLMSLSLFNFVPSCYSCNSKFKGTKEIVNTPNDIHLSPTSSLFSFNNDVKFKLFFFNGKTTSNVYIKKDFILDFTYPTGKGYEDYIDVFKLKGRYVYHKEEALELIKLKRRYPQSRLKEMAKHARLTTKQVKEDLFGKELFNSNIKDKSLIKFKRDIAKNIGIQGIV